MIFRTSRRYIAYLDVQENPPAKTINSEEIRYYIYHAVKRYVGIIIAYSF